jgi:itaconyl-CoA hydratase
MADPGRAEMTLAPEFRPYDRWWEDFDEGLVIRTRGMTVTESHIVQWANFAGDWLPLHVDQHASARTDFGSVIAHGPLTLALSLGLVIQTGCFGDAVIAWLGLDEVRATAPVRPGDTIQVEAAVTHHRPSRSKPDRGAATLAYTVRNQDDVVVMTFTSGFLMRRRPAA